MNNVLFFFASVVLGHICVNVNTLLKKYFTFEHSELQKSQCREGNLLQLCIPQYYFFTTDLT